MIRNAPALALAACSLTVVACGKAKTPPAEPRTPVLVTRITQSALAEERILTATVRARVETELGFRTGGKLVERLVEVGDTVTAGQPLGRLDVTDHGLGVEAAIGHLRAATVDAEQAASDEARMRRLLADGSVGVADHERQKARADAAAARLDQARRSLSLARNKVRYTTLESPYAGVVTALRMEVGQVVSEGQPVAWLAREGEREIVADLPEVLVDRVRELRASATLWGRDEEPMELRLREVSPLASTSGGTFRVRYSIPAHSGPAARQIALGTTARLRLASDGTSGVSLPASALVKSSNAAGVWVVDAASGGVAFKPVEVQAFAADGVRVSGLAEGLLVVTVGAQKVHPTMKVTPVDHRPASAEARRAPP
jgi:RND family efflux transporter MFP subunit